MAITSRSSSTRKLSSFPHYFIAPIANATSIFFAKIRQIPGVKTARATDPFSNEDDDYNAGPFGIVGQPDPGPARGSGSLAVGGPGRTRPTGILAIVNHQSPITSHQSRLTVCSNPFSPLSLRSPCSKICLRVLLSQRSTGSGCVESAIDLQSKSIQHTGSVTQ